MNAIICLLLLVSFPLAASAAPSKRHAPSANVTGHYVNRYSNVSDSLDVLRLKGNKIKFRLVALLLGTDSPRNGEVHGITTLNNNIAVYDSGDGCRVKMIFSQDRVSVSVDDGDACGFGAYVTADGKYKKSNSSVPKFDF
jgi:hypothetical protein